LSSKGSSDGGLVLRVVILRDGGTFKRWDLLRTVYLFQALTSQGLMLASWSALVLTIFVIKSKPSL
jgi:hypothetical protein